MDLIISNNSKVKLREFFFFFLIVFLFVFFGLDNRELGTPDEARYVEISREMVETGDYVTPRLNGVKYFEKPPLVCWLEALSIKAFGINLFCLRAVISLLGLLGIFAIFILGVSLYGKIVGYISSGILATTLMYYVHSRLIILDMAVCTFITMAMACFILAFFVHDKDQTSILKFFNKKKLYIMLFYASCACAVLSKGLVGIIIPGMIIVSWIMCTKKFYIFVECFYWPGIFLFLCIVMPWHIMVSLKNREFLHFYFIVEHVLRYTTTIHNRIMPWWFFSAITVVGLIPWSGFSLIAITNLIKKYKSQYVDSVFFICWIFVPLIFFSISQSKLIPYILPIFPPIALVTAKWIFDNLIVCEPKKMSALNYSFCINLFITMIMFVAVFFYKDRLYEVLHFGRTIEILSIICLTVILYTVIVMVANFVSQKFNTQWFLLCYFILSMHLMLTFNNLAPIYQNIHKPSAKDAAEAISLNLLPDDKVFCFKYYFQDVPIFLKKTVGVVDYRGELGFGIDAEDHSDRFFEKDDFWNLWKSTAERIILIMSRKKYTSAFVSKELLDHKILFSSGDFVVIMNK